MWLDQLQADLLSENVAPKATGTLARQTKRLPTGRSPCHPHRLPGLPRETDFRGEISGCPLEARASAAMLYVIGDGAASVRGPVGKIILLSVLRRRGTLSLGHSAK